MEKTHTEVHSGGGWRVERRDFLARSGLVIAGAACGACAGKPHERVAFGIVTDAHYADTEMRRNRYYRQTTLKMAECIRCMNDQKVDFLIELGDFKDQDEPPEEARTLQDLEAIEKVFARFKGPRYHVLGNHDMDTISKRQFMERIENSGIRGETAYYSFDCKGLHFVVLDANFTADGTDYDHNNFQWDDANIPQRQLEWLARDLADAQGPVIVFVHQQLDENGGFTIRNAGQVRVLLEESGKVLAVFQGHYHEGMHHQINGIHYYTLKAMVDGSGEINNAYAVVRQQADGSLVVTGYGKVSPAMHLADAPA